MIMIRPLVIVCMAGALGACAGEPISGPRLAPMMLGATAAEASGISSPSAEAAPAAEAVPHLPRTSLAAKVLGSRALERVTGLKTDPARLSEHD
jgi:hypothetical protein